MQGTGEWLAEGSSGLRTCTKSVRGAIRIFPSAVLHNCYV